MDNLRKSAEWLMNNKKVIGYAFIALFFVVVAQQVYDRFVKSRENYSYYEGYSNAPKSGAAEDDAPEAIIRMFKVDWCPHCKKALPEFQQAENHPHKRLPAMLYSARCLAARNMNDMAARKLQTALKEKAGFDDERKELLYTLGCVLEKAGKLAEAITQFEQIYEVDMKFRDVAARVDDYHAGQG